MRVTRVLRSHLGDIDLQQHKDVDKTLSASRKSAIEPHNAKTHVVPYKPTVRDYVVVARTHEPRTKMSANWAGPRPISRILSNVTVEIKHLLTSAAAVVYVCRVKTYADASVGTPAQMQEVEEFTDRIWHSVDKIKDVGEAAGHFEVLIAWKGLNAAGDSWETRNVIFENVPSKVRVFFNRECLNPILRRSCASIASKPAVETLLRYLTAGRPRGRSYARRPCRQHQLAGTAGYLTFLIASRGIYINSMI